MNKAYRVVWNARTSTWTAVHKNVKAKGKAAASGLASITSVILGKSPRVAYAAVASAMMMAAGSANAGPGIFVSAAAYYSVNDGGTHGDNYSGNGATQPSALAAGVGAIPHCATRLLSVRTPKPAAATPCFQMQLPSVRTLKRTATSHWLSVRLSQ